MFEGRAKASFCQVQLAHDARPSILFNIRDSFGDFLKEIAEKKEGYPSSLDGLLNEGGIKLVLTDKADPDNVGFVQSTAQRPLASDCLGVLQCVPVSGGGLLSTLQA